MKVLFLFFSLLSVCLGSCHGDCSGNGECFNTECECFDDWAGNDCSIPYLPLLTDTPVSMVVQGSWVYFYTVVPDNVSLLTYEMKGANLIGECDIYVKFNNFPSKSSYDFTDNGWSSNSKLKIHNPTSGIWTSGVYNFFSCSFTLTAHIELSNNCPHQCSGFGTCSNSVCLCDGEHFGMDCSSVILPITNSTLIQNTIRPLEWKFFFYDSIQTLEFIPQFNVSINEFKENQEDECTDLYIKLNSLPTLWEFDFRNALSFSNYSISVGNPYTGRYYIGVYGNGKSECDFSISLKTKIGDCDKCSNHGYCSNGLCICTEDYEGHSCEYMNRDLVEGESVEGFVSDNQWNYYSVQVNSADNLVVTIHQDKTDGGDCDLYIQPGEYPDKENFLYRDLDYQNTFSIVIENPMNVHWMIGVYGYVKCNYYISAVVASQICPKGCSGKGSCVNGRCTCDSGFAGDDCASEIKIVNSGVVVNGTVSVNKWAFFSYSLPKKHSSVTIVLGEKETIGKLDVYTLVGSLPNLSDHDHFDNSLSKVHTIYFLTNPVSNQEETLFVGVYGSTAVSFEEEVAFSLFVFSPPI